MQVKPSRTFGLAAAGLISLSLLGLGLFTLLVWAIGYSESPIFPGQLVGCIQIIAGCIASVATVGAGSMAARDWRSGGLTSSQAHQVLTAKLMVRGPKPQSVSPDIPEAVAQPEDLS